MARKGPQGKVTSAVVLYIIILEVVQYLWRVQFN